MRTPGLIVLLGAVCVFAAVYYFLQGFPVSSALLARQAVYFFILAFVYKLAVAHDTYKRLTQLAGTKGHRLEKLANFMHMKRTTRTENMESGVLRSDSMSR